MTLSLDKPMARVGPDNWPLDIYQRYKQVGATHACGAAHAAGLVHLASMVYSRTGHGVDSGSHR